MNVMDKSIAAKRAAKKSPAPKTPGRTSVKGKTLDVDLATTKPGTRGVFMRQFWIAVHRGEDIAPGEARF